MAEWAAEATPARIDDNLRAIKRYAWIDDADAEEFYRRALDLVNEFAQLPRRNPGKAHAFMVALYPTHTPDCRNPRTSRGGPVGIAPRVDAYPWRSTGIRS